MTDDFTSALEAITTPRLLAKEDMAAFPAIPDRYWEAPQQAVVPAESSVPLDRSERLEKLLDLSLDKAEELLELPVDQLDENYTKVASMQKDLVVSIVNAGIKVDENRFKKKTADALSAVLTQIAAAERHLNIGVQVPVLPGQGQQTTLLPVLDGKS